MELPIRYLNEKGQLDDGETSQMRYVYDIMYGEGEPTITKIGLLSFIQAR